MNGHCDYRVSVVEPGHIGPRFPIADCIPDSWLCGCPAGEHALGLNCVDDKAKCRIAKRYEKDFMPSYAYKRQSTKEIKAQEQAVETVAAGLPEELGEIVRQKYQIKRKKAS